jgi:uncharacterized membrane protein
MLEKHNIDYGFARNLAGMRWLFVGSSLLGALGCTIAWKFDHGSLTGLVLTLCLLTYAIIMSLWLPTYVERCADRYAESFFSLPVFTTNKKSANSENSMA